MALELVSLFEGWISILNSLTNNIFKFRQVHSLDLLVTGSLCTENIPAIVDILEVATIASEMEHVLVFETSGGNCNDRLPYEQSQEVHCKYLAHLKQEALRMTI